MHRMAAPECIPLNMEPETAFYRNPVLVLDFQSLYPSVVIAYNYCYTTCLGKVYKIDGSQSIQFGCATLNLPNRSKLAQFQDNDQIHISPAGVAFLKKSVRVGIIPTMLDEVLETRVMVKQCGKKYKSDKALYSILDARQLGLKLISNTTYGYTAANFSGRMACVEVADSIVHKGRETLENAIKLVNEEGRNGASARGWYGARVVYGDTDSLFVSLPADCTKSEAFLIGQQMVDTITSLNPAPVKLKFEKVFMPCVLLSKKRYVGYSFESVDQKEAIFDAKGIETVRRDGCPLVVETFTSTLHNLFSSNGDIQSAKLGVCAAIGSVYSGAMPLSQFVFAKEYRGRKFYRPQARVAALKIAIERASVDLWYEPLKRERVPYIIANGSPNATLHSCVVDAFQALARHTEPNYDYYIKGQLVPVLNRVFVLLGVDVFDWLPYLKKYKSRRARLRIGLDGSRLGTKASGQRQGTLLNFVQLTECPVCCKPAPPGAMCQNCAENPQVFMECDCDTIDTNFQSRSAIAMVVLSLEQSLFTSANHLARLQSSTRNLHRICFTCVGSVPELTGNCSALHCPVLNERERLGLVVDAASSALRVVKACVEMF